MSLGQTPGRYHSPLIGCDAQQPADSNDVLLECIGFCYAKS